MKNLGDFKELIYKPTYQQLTLSSTLSFSDYIKLSQELILANRVDITEDNKTKILQANSPFELIPNNPMHDVGILLIHGLFDSPLVMQDIANYFYQKGYPVRCILLPGHGTRPGDLITVNYQQWLDTARYGLTSFSHQVKKMVVVGFSTGALLSINLALQHEKIDSLILLAPGISAKYQFIWLSKLYQKMATIWPIMQWLHKGKNQDYARYESFPVNAINQFYLLTQATAKLSENKPLNLPIFMALTDDDYVVNTKSAINWFMQQTNARNQIILYTNSKKISFHQQIKYTPSAYATLYIKNFSHVCIPISPANSHYGTSGDYCNFQSPEAFSNAKQILMAGSRNPYFINHRNLLNLSYNPDFDALIKAMGAFIL